ncbi:MAG: metal-dependent hydrolase, partial [archaeon]
VIGGGLERRPWLGNAEKGVYVHATRRWVRPKQWIRYDGAPEDLVAAGFLAVPGLLTFGGHIRTVVLVSLAISVAYTVTRKWLVEVVPERFL